MSSSSLLEEGQIIAGPWHTAFGFLVRSHILHKRMENNLPLPGLNERIKILVPQREIPLVRGYKNQGLQFLRKKTGASVIEVEADASIPSGRVRVERI